jgi:hypothetical protein
MRVPLENDTSVGNYLIEVRKIFLSKFVDSNEKIVLNLINMFKISVFQSDDARGFMNCGLLLSVEKLLLT